MVQIQPPAIVRGLSPLSDSLPFFPWCQEAFMFWALGSGGAGAIFYAFELTYLHVSSVLFLACLPAVFLEPLFFPGVRVHTDEWCVFTGAQKRSLELWLLLGAWKQSHQQGQRVRTEAACPGRPWTQVCLLFLAFVQLLFSDVREFITPQSRSQLNEALDVLLVCEIDYEQNDPYICSDWLYYIYSDDKGFRAALLVVSVLKWNVFRQLNFWDDRDYLAVWWKSK